MDEARRLMFEASALLGARPTEQHALSSLRERGVRAASHAHHQPSRPCRVRRRPRAATNAGGGGLSPMVRLLDEASVLQRPIDEASPLQLGVSASRTAVARRAGLMATRHERKDRSDVMPRAQAQLQHDAAKRLAKRRTPGHWSTKRRTPTTNTKH